MTLIIARSALVSFLTGPHLNPDQDHAPELKHIAESVFNDSSEEFTHFVFLDHESGDPYLQGEQVAGPDLIPQQEGAWGYYGLTVHSSAGGGYGQSFYSAYLGGSTLLSATGFTLLACNMAPGE